MSTDSCPRNDATSTRFSQLALEIEEIATAYCGDSHYPVLYAQAIVMAQFDIMICRLRAQEIAYMDAFDFLSGCDPKFLNKFRAATYTLERLTRLEKQVWRSRKRALRTFLAMKRC